MAEPAPETPLRIINSSAPIRICDIGGWTDTWFARHGKTFNIGVHPSVEVQIAVYARAARSDRIVLHVENYGDRYALNPGKVGVERHRLLEAAIDELAPPEQYALEIAIYSAAPAPPLAPRPPSRLPCSARSICLRQGG